MDDALELSIQDNEFDGELPQNDETQEISAQPELPDTKVKLETAFDPNDYISLTEAKQKLLQSLEQYDLKDDVKLCSRGLVKSRLGVREEGAEVMEYSDSNDLEGSDPNTRENEITGPNQDGSDGSQSTSMFKCTLRLPAPIQIKYGTSLAAGLPVWKVCIARPRYRAPNFQTFQSG